MNKSSFRRAFYIIICSISLYSCASLPVNSEGTLERARGDELVVGISENKPWTQTSGTGRYSGIEVDLIEGFADTIDADVQWLHAPESVLAEKIKNGQLDLMIGGLSSSSPWSSHMALSRPYHQFDGEEKVMGIRLGENDLMMALERYLAHEFGEIR